MELLPVRTNYFVGSRDNWRTGIASYARVRYRDVYPGIDVVYYGNERQLEYDFVLRPGADPREIRLHFAGAGHLRINSEGDLVLESPAGRMVQHRPAVYQQDPNTGSRREVAAHYRLLAHNVAAIRVEHFDRSAPLVIDPVLTYATYLGGGATDIIYATQIDSHGQLYIAGSTTNGDLQAVGNAYSTSNKGNTDAFLAIFDTTQSSYPVTYLSYLGGSNNDGALAMALDTQSHVFLTGTTSSNDFPIVGNAVQATGGATAQYAFVSEIDPTQSGSAGLVYSTYLGGSQATNSGNGIALDHAGHIYVIGTTQAGDFPLSPNPYQGNLFGTQDAFICEIDPNAGGFVYSSYMGGELLDDGRGIAVGANGLVYFAVTTESTLFPQAGGSFSSQSFGGYDVAIGVMDFTQPGFNSLVYTTYYGGSGNDEVRKLVLDARGNLVLTGYTLSTDFPVTKDAVQSANGGNADAFVAVLNPSTPGLIVYSTYLGGSGGDVAYDVAADPSGNIYVTGYTQSSNFPVTGNAPQAQWGNVIDVFVAKLRPGTPGLAGLQYSTYLGGATINVGYGLALNPAGGSVYVAGMAGNEFPVTSNATQAGYAGGSSDGFIAILTEPTSTSTTPSRRTPEREHQHR